MLNRVGIVTVADSRKGLWRDMETLSWALAMPSPRYGGKRADKVHVFCSKDMSEASSPNVRSSFPEGGSSGADLFRGSFSEFAEQSDVVVFFERLQPTLIRFLLKKGKRVAYIPNLDWAVFSGSPLGWKREVQSLQKEEGFQVWARQPSILSRLDKLGIQSVYVPWSIPDAVVRSPKTLDDESPVHFFINAGFGGFKGRRAVDTILRAYGSAKRSGLKAQLTIKSIKPLVEYVGDALAYLDDDVAVIEGFCDREQINRLMCKADVVLHVSRWEGFGYAAIEALHAGKPVITHDGSPVGDLVEDGHNGLVLKAHDAGYFNLTKSWEVHPEELAQAMVRLDADRKLLRRLTVPSPGELLARQTAFRMHVRRLLLQESMPRVVIVGSEPGKALVSEKYWQMALEAHGYEVDYVFKTASNFRAVLAQPIDFILAGKPFPSQLNKVKKDNVLNAPILVWHHDQSMIVKDVQPEYKQMADLIFAPYDDDEDCIYLLPGPRSGGDRGRGLRPRYRASLGPFKHDASFIGARCKERQGVMDRLIASTSLTIWGPDTGRAPIYDDDADRAYLRSKVVLSMSRSHHAKGYTSNRLFHAAALGAPVVAVKFPGCYELFPERLKAIKFVHFGEMIDAVNEMVKNHDVYTECARELESHCWRHHSWHDRIFTLLQKLNQHMPEIMKQLSKRQGPNPPPPAAPKVLRDNWTGPKRVNIGSGPRTHSGYENLDVRAFPGVRKHDITKGLPYPDGVLHEVLAEDVLEHFRPTLLRETILPEIFRVLRSGGKLVAQMPDLHEMVSQWQRGLVDDEMMSMRIHGRQDYPENTHYASYTEASMTKLLLRAGFSFVRRVDTRNWNMVLEAHKGPVEGLSRSTSRKDFKPQPGNGAGTNWSAYWEQRSKKMGQLSVTPGSWNELRQRQESDKLFKLMEGKWAERQGSLVLDYGTGVGRMAQRLHSAGLKVKGVDVSPSMVALAQKNGVDASLMADGKIPFDDATFDALFVCTVLQHIPDKDLKSAVDEICRVLKPGAFVMLFENCEKRHGRTSSSGHVVFRDPGEYISLFEGIQEFYRYTVENEEHALMWGTLEPEPEPEPEPDAETEAEDEDS